MKEYVKSMLHMGNTWILFIIIMGYYYHCVCILSSVFSELNWEVDPDRI